MGIAVRRALVLVIAAGFALPLRSAQCQTGTPARPADPPRWKSTPYTEESTQTTCNTAADGATTTRPLVYTTTAKDSQGRELFKTTQTANDISSYIVDDPVAGTRTVWNTLKPQVRVLMFPTPVSGRESCWRIPLAEQNVARDEAQFGLLGMSCAPAGRHQLPYCERGEAIDPPRDDSSQVKATYEYCSRLLASVVIPGKISEKDEDLGTESILGFEAHGCRSTTVIPAGDSIRELWMVKFGTEKRSFGFTLRSADETPSSAKQTVTTNIEVTRLDFGEPDPAIFLPPKGYEVKTVQMHEVPCDQASNPMVDEGSTH
jgi:hypothetical protein